MAEKLPTEKIISTEDKVIRSKGNEQLVQRTTITERDGGRYRNTSQIVKKKIRREMLPQVVERMKWKKFGKVAGQERGVLEPGIVIVSSEEVHIINRLKDVEQDIGDKLRENISNTKVKILNSIKEEREREEKKILEAYAKQSNKNQKQKSNRRRDNNSTIKVNGFNPNCKAERLAEIFEKAGPVQRVTMVTHNFAFIRFENSVHKYRAYEMFNDHAVDGCILQVQLLDDR